MKILIQRLSAALLLCLAAASVTVGCNYTLETGSDGSDADLGYVDGLGLDPKFIPAPKGPTCPNGSCYPAQTGWANGKPVTFYNMGAVPTGSGAGAFSFKDSSGNFAIPTSSATIITFNTFDFGAASCAPPASPYTFNPQTEAFPANVQFPIFGSLPLVSYVYDSVVVPFVGRYASTEPSSTACQYVKTAASVGTKGGSQAGSLADYRMWPVIDTVTALATSATSGITSNYGVNGLTCYPPDLKPIPCPVQPLASTSLSATCGTNFNTCLSSCGIVTDQTFSCAPTMTALTCGTDGKSHYIDSGTFAQTCSTPQLQVTLQAPGSACAGNDSICVTTCETQYLECATLQKHGWYAGLQLTYLDGGEIPQNPLDPGTLRVMNGVIVHPSVATQVSKPTDTGVIILPAMPGDPGYSPLVVLYDFHVSPGEDLDTNGAFTNAFPIGKYTSICTNATCQPNEVKVDSLNVYSNLLFLVTSAP